MTGGVKMFSRVPVRRRIAAPDMSTRQAQSQMHPLRPDLQTILTPVCARDNIIPDLIKVRASLIHLPLPLPLTLIFILFSCSFSPTDESAEAGSFPLVATSLCDVFQNRNRARTRAQFFSLLKA
jgi:hypothetical protein